MEVDARLLLRSGEVVAEPGELVEDSLSIGAGIPAPRSATVVTEGRSLGGIRTVEGPLRSAQAIDLVHGQSVGALAVAQQCGDPAAGQERAEDDEDRGGEDQVDRDKSSQTGP